MNKNGLIIGLVILIGVGVGIVWMIVNKTATPSTSQQNASSNDTSTRNSTDNSTDQVQSGNVAVVMQNTAFSPQTIKVKKGTKVTWTNNDTVRHNVVADDSGNAAGLPTTNDLLDKGGSYSFTFNTVGTFHYHCTPHPFMTGSIEVVE